MRNYLFVVLMCVCLSAIATPSGRDVLFWNGSKFFIFPFVDAGKEFSNAELARLDKLTKSPSTSSYRGFHYVFEIANDSLFLVTIEDGEGADKTAFVLGSHDKRFMEDFSDTLYLGYGKSFYDEAFWTPIYESEMTVVFDKGIVRTTEDHPNQSERSPYSYDLQKLTLFVYSNIGWDVLDSVILSKKPVTYVKFSNDSIGKVQKANVVRSSGFNEFDREALRVIKSLPSLTVSYVCGKYISHEYLLAVVFDLEKAKKLEGMSSDGLPTPCFPQSCNEINSMIFKSTNDYIQRYNTWAKTLQNEDTIQFVCSDGFPTDFPFDSLMIDHFSLRWMEGNSPKVLQQFKRFTKVTIVQYTLDENRMDVFVMLKQIRRPHKRKKQIMTDGESGKHYLYQYDCNEHKWLLLN